MAIIANLVATFGATTTGFDKGTKRVRSGLASITAGVTRMIGTMAPLAGGALFASMARNAERFTQKMNQSLAIMGDVSEETQQRMSDAAFKVARDTIFSADEAAEAYFFLASAGLNAAQSIAAMPAVSAFAQAGMFSLSRATDLATDAQSALGLTVDDAQGNLENLVRVTDVLTKANTLANASVEQFSEALTTKAGASLRIVNKEIEEGVAVLAVFADQGLKGSDAGTALAIVLRDLQTKAIRFRKEFDAAGIAVFDQIGNMNNLADIVEDLEEKLLNMGAEQKKATLLALGFSDKSVIFIQTLIGMSDAIREYEKALKDAQGITQQVSDKQLTQMQRSMAFLGATATKLGVSINQQLVPSVAALLNMISGVIEAVGFAIPTMLKWGVAILAGAVASSLLGKAITSLALAYKALGTAESFVIALGGPKGIAQIAVAGTVATGVAVAMGRALGETSAAAEKTTKALDEVDKARKRIESIASGGGQGASSFLTTEDTGFDLTSIEGAIGELAKDVNGLIAQRDELNRILQAMSRKFGIDVTDTFFPQVRQLNNIVRRLADAESELLDKTGPLVDVFGNVGSAVSFLDKAITSLITPQQKFAAGQDEINSLVTEGLLNGADAAKLMGNALDRLDDATGGPVKRIRELNTEIARLQGASDRGIRMDELLQGGASLDQARAIIEKEKTVREGKEIEKATKSLLESIRTPMEVLEDSIANINRLPLTAEQQLKALDALRQEIDEEPRDVGGPQFGAALQAGSAEAFSAILAATRPEQMDQREIAKNTKRLREIAEQEAINAEIDRAAEAVPVVIQQQTGAVQ